MKGVFSRRMLWTSALAYSCVALMYAAFFAYPVNPAVPQSTFDFVIEDKEYSSFPSIHETIYTNGRALLVIATVRTVSAPNSAYSMVFDRVEGYAEEFVAENYGVEVDLREEESSESYPFSGHDAVRSVFGIYKEVAFGVEPFVVVEEVKLAEVGGLAWFCEVDFESVVLFYVTPVYFAEDASLELLSEELVSMVGDVQCH